MDTPNIGRDEWAAQADARLDRRRARWEWLVDYTETINPLVLVAALALATILVTAAGSPYILRVAALACVMATLALGLSVGVGFVGLLDLGYIAFAGIGGYTYALLSSAQLGVHLPSWAGLALAVLLAAGAALLLGLPALRLGGDHLAIVTLGFAQIFLLLALSLNRVALPWSGETVDVTGGPNGIVGVAGVALFGLTVSGQRANLLLLAVMLGIVFLGLTSLDRSAVGRAWRAIREDELAAAALGIPARRLKLLAVAIGAAVAGLAGALYAAWQGAVFPTDYGLDVLLTLYAMLLAGGLGSLPGALLGALLLTVLPELLRSPEAGRLLFYGGTVAAVLLGLRWRGLTVLGLAALLGALVRLGMGLLWPAPAPPAAGALAFVGAAALLLAASQTRRGAARIGLLAPALALLAFAWETRLAHEPSVTRQLLFGTALVLLVIKRPHGILGRPRVEVG